jgi:tryptophanyl-tRNA synthetase
VFTIPEPRIRDDVAVVPGLDGQKMSKSYNNHIEIFGDEKDTKKRVMRIVTDSKGLEDPKDPDKCNIFALYKLMADEGQVCDLAARYRAGGMGYGDAKKALFELMRDYFAPFRARREELAANMDYVEKVLTDGAERARSEACKTLSRARKVMGLD